MKDPNLCYCSRDYEGHKRRLYPTKKINQCPARQGDPVLKMNEVRMKQHTYLGYRHVGSSGEK